MLLSALACRCLQAAQTLTNVMIKHLSLGKIRQKILAFNRYGLLPTPNVVIKSSTQNAQTAFSKCSSNMSFKKGINFDAILNTVHVNSLQGGLTGFLKE